MDRLKLNRASEEEAAVREENNRNTDQLRYA